MTTPRTLRTRWHRAFALLLLAMVAGGAVSVAGTRIVVGDYRDTAKQLEAQETLLAQLRADVVPYAIAVATLPAGNAKVVHLRAAVRAGFAKGLDVADSSATRRPLQQAFATWSAMVATIDAADTGLSPAQRGALVGGAIAIEAPKVLALLDAAGTAGRAEARDALTANADVERAAYAVLVVLILLALVLMLRLARRLSVEILLPVSSLRDSANRLAAGDLGHRVAVERDDELGDLAHSFNAMADAISGTQTSLIREANHDSLTGLANRAGFRTRVDEVLTRPDRRDGTQALLFVDLDDFKDVNDLLGHAAGDLLLCSVAERLVEVVRPSDLVARLGGDEFALLLDGIPNADAAYTLAARAVATLAEPIQIMGHWVHVGASIGLAMRHDGSDLDGLMREADVAMYSAKAHGKNRVEGYDATLHTAVVEHQSLKAEVQHAAERGELVLDYQPVVDLNSGELVGMEALVRWQHPTRGLLAPSAFIQLAEDTGAIHAIGTWVLRTAAQQGLQWQRRYSRPDLTVSVNVSVRQLDRPDFVHLVSDVLVLTGLDPRTLILEVTESVLADPEGSAAASLEALRARGIRVALDDFGTGYSSIGYLRQLPVDVLKIDRSFVSGPTAGGSGHALLEAIVGLGHRLGLAVIPEGIEHPEDLQRLQALGCVAGQGFLLSRPVPATEIDELLAAFGPPFALRLLGAAVPLPRDAKAERIVPEPV